MIKLRAHAYADLFPLMSDEEFNRLCADIKVNGQIKPIEMWNGVILDGRNRYNACLKLGIQPKTINVHIDKPLDHVLSLNLSRRHLNESQRAMVGAKLKEMAIKPSATLVTSTNNNHLDTKTQICVPTNAELAKQLNVSERSISTANQVLEKASDEVITQIEAGTKSVNEAKTELAKPTKHIPTPKEASKAARRMMLKVIGKLQFEDAQAVAIELANHLEQYD